MSQYMDKVLAEAGRRTYYVGEGFTAYKRTTMVFAKKLPDGNYSVLGDDGYEVVVPAGEFDYHYELEQ